MADDITDSKQPSSNSCSGPKRLGSPLPPPYKPPTIHQKRQSQTQLPPYNNYAKSNSRVSTHKPYIISLSHLEIKAETYSKTPPTAEYTPNTHLHNYQSSGTLTSSLTTPCSIHSNPCFPDTTNLENTVDNYVENIVDKIITQYSTKNQQTHNNTSNNSNQSSNNKNNTHNAVGNNGGSGWHSWNSSHGNNDDGDDEKKRENNKHINSDHNVVIVIKKKEQNEEKKEENENDLDDNDTTSKLRPQAHTFRPAGLGGPSKSAATLKTLFEHEILDPAFKSISAPLPCKIKPAPIRTSTKQIIRPYFYYPNAVYGVRGIIKISTDMTDNMIPNMVQESIQNVFDFMDKKTAMNMHDRLVFSFADFRIFNYGFHDKCGNILYCIVDRINHRNYQYKMRDKLYTKYEVMKEVSMYDGYSLPESALPMVSQVFADDIYKIYGQFKDAAGLCQRVIFKAKWHKIHVFNKNNKNFNKRRLTYSLTKPQFINTYCLTFNKNNLNFNKVLLVPIVMFAKNGYRVEYVQIVSLRDNIDIGVAYIFDKNTGLKVTGIHLDKNNILKQHQLLAPYHDCHCLDTFKSEIDDLHIGNPDDDRNRVNALKDQNKKLRGALEDALDRIKQLECVNNITPLTNYTLSPITTRSTAPNTPFRTPQSFYSNYTPQSVSSHLSVGNNRLSPLPPPCFVSPGGNQQASLVPRFLMQNYANYNTTGH